MTDEQVDELQSTTMSQSNGWTVAPKRATSDFRVAAKYKIYVTIQADKVYKADVYVNDLDSSGRIVSKVVELATRIASIESQYHSLLVDVKKTVTSYAPADHLVGEVTLSGDFGRVSSTGGPNVWVVECDQPGHRGQLGPSHVGRIPSIRIELESMKHAMVKAFSEENLRLDEAFKQSIDKACDPEAVQQIMNDTAKRFLDEAITNEVKHYLTAGNGRMLLREAVQKRLDEMFGIPTEDKTGVVGQEFPDQVDARTPEMALEDTSCSLCGQTIEMGTGFAIKMKGGQKVRMCKTCVSADL